MPPKRGANASVIRILMIGDSAVGKTSLVIRFDEDSFSTKFITTIGVDYRDKLVDIEGSPIKLQVRCPPALPSPLLSSSSVRLDDAHGRCAWFAHFPQIWDTAGQERFRSLTANFFGKADVRAWVCACARCARVWCARRKSATGLVHGAR